MAGGEILPLPMKGCQQMNLKDRILGRGNDPRETSPANETRNPSPSGAQRMGLGQTAPGDQPRRRATDRPQGLPTDITPEEFVMLLVKAERELNRQEADRQKYTGCHWIISGAREHFKRAFPSEDDIALTDRMVKRGLLRRRWAKAGPIFFLPEDWQERSDHKLELGAFVQRSLREMNG